jgi:hypothetical protein
MDRSSSDKLRSSFIGTIGSLLVFGGRENAISVIVAGGIAGLPKRWVDYHPVYRTSVGTGIGLRFGVWGGS